MVENIVVSGSKSTSKPNAEKVVPVKPAALKKETAKAIVNKASSKKATAVDYSKMTVAELKAAAKVKGIAGYTTFKKAELIKALSK